MLNSQNVAMYERIKSELIHKIDSEFYPDNAKLPSENQLTQIYSVSRITATKALTELSLEGYVYRIQGKGSYVIPKSERPLVAPATGFTFKPQNTTIKIGIIVPENVGSHASQLISGITNTLPFPKYFCNICLARYDDLEDFSINYYKNNGYDGIIFFPADAEFYNKTILELHINNYPLVLIDRNLPGINSNFVSCNNSVAIQMAVEQLISLGHTKLAFITNSSPAELTTALRHESFISSLQTNSNTKNSYPFSYFNAVDDSSFIDNFINLVQTKQVTSVITGNADTARFLYHLCQKHNINIPQDLSIISFDCPDDVTFPFTFIDQEAYEIGRESAHIMMNLVADSIEKKQHYQLLLTPKLVIGKSTAPYLK